MKRGSIASYFLAPPLLHLGVYSLMPLVFAFGSIFGEEGAFRAQFSYIVCDSGLQVFVCVQNITINLLAPFHSSRADQTEAGGRCVLAC